MHVRAVATTKASVLLAGTLLAAPSAAVASPSLDQYVESVPSSQGPQRPAPPSHGHTSETSGKGGSAPTQLPAATRHALARLGGSSAPALNAIATDPGRGAPTGATPTTKSGSGGGHVPSRNGRQGGGSSTPSSSPSALSAAVHGAGSGQGAQLPLLLLGLLAITAVSAAMALRSRTRGS
ncbi:MAG: hypothetical protein QOF65_522 [Thermoleophilaceae bacterium]|jgi:hypothetical protein|nr:hypothetical protein [Thermoleophilaceae bacterium]MEA2435966.1 hypothetical protein [Thermoleophilaceae bacterium]